MDIEDIKIEIRKVISNTPDYENKLADWHIKEIKAAEQRGIEKISKMIIVQMGLNVLGEQSEYKTLSEIEKIINQNTTVLYEETIEDKL